MSFAKQLLPPPPKHPFFNHARLFNDINWITQSSYLGRECESLSSVSGRFLPRLKGEPIQTTKLSVWFPPSNEIILRNIHLFARKDIPRSVSLHTIAPNNCLRITSKLIDISHYLRHAASIHVGGFESIPLFSQKCWEIVKHKSPIGHQSAFPFREQRRSEPLSISCYDITEKIMRAIVSEPSITSWFKNAFHMKQMSLILIVWNVWAPQKNS